MLLSTASALGPGCRGAEPAPLVRHEFSEVHMGAEIRLILYSADHEAANRAAQAAYARIEALNKTLSDYDPKSELSLLNATAGTGTAKKVSDDLWFVLERGRRLSVETDGAFDITIGPLVKVWRSARRTHTFPSDERLAKARSVVGYQSLRLDLKGRTAELLKAGMQLDLGGIGMGYAADEALAVIRRHGINSAMVDASGDIVCSDAPPGRDGWRIGIAPLTESKGPPSRYVALKNGALTTSGDAFQFVELQGKRYSHIVDPKTGLGLTTRSSVTVVAPTCITADSLATALCVLGAEKGKRLIEQNRGAAALFVYAEDSVVKTVVLGLFPSGPN